MLEILIEKKNRELRLAAIFAPALSVSVSSCAKGKHKVFFLIVSKLPTFLDTERFFNNSFFLEIIFWSCQRLYEDIYSVFFSRILSIFFFRDFLKVFFPF